MIHIKKVMYVIFGVLSIILMQVVYAQSPTISAPPVPPPPPGVPLTAAPGYTTPGAVATMSRAERIKRHQQLVEQLRKERMEKMKMESAAQSQMGLPGTSFNPGDTQGNAPLPVLPAAKSGSAITGTLHFDPIDQAVTVGDKFYTPLILENGTDVLFDEITLKVKYDPNFLKPLRVYDSKIRLLLDAPPEFTVDYDRGIIFYRGTLTNAHRIRNNYLINILWEAQRDSISTTLALIFEGSDKTQLTFEGKDVLGEQISDTDGFIRSNILIKPIGGKESYFTSNNKRSFFAFENIDEEKMGDIRLYLETDSIKVTEGEEFIVKIIAANPKNSPIDNVSIWVKFNPSELEAVDWDKGNWISRGININDGGLHNIYPFDLLVANEANNFRGEIEYRMGFLTPAVLDSGVLAQIKFKALKPAVASSVYFGFNRYPKYPNTIITLQGIDMLGSPFAETDGVINKLTLLINKKSEIVVGKK